MSWMTKVKPEEKTNPAQKPGTGVVKILHTIGDIYGNFILLGPLHNGYGVVIEDEVWVDMRTITIVATGNTSSYISFEGKTDLNHPIARMTGWLNDAIMQMIP